MNNLIWKLLGGVVIGAALGATAAYIETKKMRKENEKRREELEALLNEPDGSDHIETLEDDIPVEEDITQETDVFEEPEGEEMPAEEEDEEQEGPEVIIVGEVSEDVESEEE